MVFLQNMHLVKFLEDYTPSVCCKVAYWKPPFSGFYKCNSDGAFRGNPSPSSSVFCIRNEEGVFLYAESIRLEDGTNLVAETIALRLGLEYSLNQRFCPLILETDSMSLKKILDGEWEVPWSISMDIRRIKALRTKAHVIVVVHTLGEGNKLADFFANYV